MLLLMAIGISLRIMSSVRVFDQATPFVTVVCCLFKSIHYMRTLVTLETNHHCTNIEHVSSSLVFKSGNDFVTTLSRFYYDYSYDRNKAELFSI